jgi:NAD+ synthase (glutamine-hydrolysing)
MAYRIFPVRHQLFERCCQSKVIGRKWAMLRHEGHILRVALAQINPTVGDLSGNSKKIITFIDDAKSQGADLVVFPEMATTGYPPEDLLLKPQFIAENMLQLDALRNHCRDIVAVVGFVDVGSDLFNAAAVIGADTGKVVYHKMFLPNYGVFDEDRYFRAGTDALVFSLNGSMIGVTICEDIWHPAGPMVAQVQRGAQLILNISSSPYQKGKGLRRESMLATRAFDQTAAIAFVNMVGGQDELVFDGGSVVISETGDVLARACQFDEQLLVCDVDMESIFRARLHDPKLRKEPVASEGIPGKSFMVSSGLKLGERSSIRTQVSGFMEPVAEVYKALVTGTRDYVTKNGFKKVLVGLSGGIDSALVATIAADAIGEQNVIGVAMPSRYTARQSNDDAAILSSNLGIELKAVPIEDVFDCYLNTLKPLFVDLPHDIAEQNIQARIRGNILMALSNKFGWLVLTTGNKSEIATGYCTLYGDMAGGFAVLKDVTKTLVYQLSEYRNKRDGKEVIPQRILNREPTAELAPGQRDCDSLPSYSLLDPILVAYVEEDRSIHQLAKMGFNPDVVRKVAEMVDHSEYKRRQSAPGVKITARAFGRDRRLPITNRYREK